MRTNKIIEFVYKSQIYSHLYSTTNGTYVIGIPAFDTFLNGTLVSENHGSPSMKIDASHPDFKEIDSKIKRARMHS